MSHMRHLSSISSVRRMLITVPVIATLVIALAIWSRLSAQTQPAASPSCETLASVALPNTTITAAQTVSAGAFTPPAEALLTGLAKILAAPKDNAQAAAK